MSTQSSSLLEDISRYLPELYSRSKNSRRSLHYTFIHYDDEDLRHEADIVLKDIDWIERKGFLTPLVALMINRGLSPSSRIHLKSRYYTKFASEVLSHANIFKLSLISREFVGIIGKAIKLSAGAQFCDYDELSKAFFSLDEKCEASIAAIRNIRSNKDDLKFHIKDSFPKIRLALSSELASLWFLTGSSFDEILSALKMRLELCLDLTRINHPMALDDLFGSIKGNILIAYPELWGQYKIEPQNFLGFDAFAYRDETLDIFERTLINTISPVLSHYHGKIDYPIANHLKKHMPAVFDPKLVRFEGSRSREWCEQIVDIKPLADELNRFHTMEIWHPLCNRPEFSEIVGAPLESTLVYLEIGASYRLEIARRMIGEGRVKVDDLIEGITTKAQFRSLISITTLTSNQIAKLPAKFKKLLLLDSLGV